MASIFLIGAIGFILITLENLVKFKKKWYEYALLSFLILTSATIFYASNIKTYLFDKRDHTLKVFKRSCLGLLRSELTFDLRELEEVRAVWRGLKSKNISNEHYSIVLEFNTKEEGSSSSDSDKDVFHKALSAKNKKRIDWQNEKEASYVQNNE
jgi:hypothetical protein